MPEAIRLTAVRLNNWLIETHNEPADCVGRFYWNNRCGKPANEGSKKLDF